MIRRAALGLIAVTAGAAMAQTPRLPPGLTPLGPVQTPLAPPLAPATTTTPNSGPTIQSEPLAPPAVTVAPAPVPAVTPTPAATPPPAPTPTPTPIPAPSPAPTSQDWLPRPGVTLLALDKVTARATVLTGKTDEPLRFGTLNILVRSCLVRPPDRAADATAFLEVTERGTTQPLFRGWMLLSAPSIAVIEHPVYDIRLAGCR